MARKVLQNWLYWIVIDAAAVVLYWQTGFYATVALFALYTVLATLGLLSWLRLLRQGSATP
jgi:nicotinamide mononucleotide transporter